MCVPITITNGVSRDHLIFMESRLGNISKKCVSCITHILKMKLKILTKKMIVGKQLKIYNFKSLLYGLDLDYNILFYL